MEPVYFIPLRADHKLEMEPKSQAGISSVDKHQFGYGIKTVLSYSTNRNKRVK